MWWKALLICLALLCRSSVASAVTVTNCSWMWMGDNSGHGSGTYTEYYSDGTYAIYGYSSVFGNWTFGYYNAMNMNISNGYGSPNIAAVCRTCFSSDGDRLSFLKCFSSNYTSGSLSDSAVVAICGGGGQTCTGAAYWTAVTDSNTGNIVWSLTMNNCQSGCYPVCPTNAPAHVGDTISTGCASGATGTCPSHPFSCTGTCYYQSAAAPNGGQGFVWTLSAGECASGPNCSCPSSPGTACPTALGQTTSVACGATGGACTGNNNNNNNNNQTGCDSSCVYKWIIPTTNTCSGASGCSWAVSVNRNPSLSVTNYTWVFVGQTGPECSSCDCSLAPQIDAKQAFENGTEYMTIACPGSVANGATGSWVKQSGNCGDTCECPPPTTAGTTNNQTQTVACAAKAPSCECKFSWAAAKTALTSTVATKLGYSIPGGENRSDADPCWTWTIDVLGNSQTYGICLKYSNPVGAFQTGFETLRNWFRTGCKFFVWYWLVTWIWDFFLRG